MTPLELALVDVGDFLGALATLAERVGPKEAHRLIRERVAPHVVKLELDLERALATVRQYELELQRLSNEHARLVFERDDRPRAGLVGFVVVVRIPGVDASFRSRHLSRADADKLAIDVASSTDRAWVIDRSRR